jgi:phosphoenolpyruvate phosphomutase
MAENNQTLSFIGWVSSVEKRQKLRQLLTSADVTRFVGAHSGITARQIELAGFEAIWASGLEISASHGVPDCDLLTMTEFLHAADSINEATSLPVLADCDSGHGDALNVARLVHEYERHGIAGICLEDKAFPKINSFAAGPQTLTTIDDFVTKIRAAKDVQRDPEFVVVARVEALIAGRGIDEALDRALAYEAADADAIVIHSRAKTAAEIRAFMAQWSGRVPIVTIPTTYPSVTLEELKRLGVGAVIFANPVLRSAIPSIAQNLAVLAQTGTLASIEPNLASLEDVFALQRAVGANARTLHGGNP